jgi:hypothetical protein
VILIALALVAVISTCFSSYLLYCDIFKGYTALSENRQTDRYGLMNKETDEEAVVMFFHCTYFDVLDK